MLFIPDSVWEERGPHAEATGVRPVLCRSHNLPQYSFGASPSATVAGNREGQSKSKLIFSANHH